MSQTTWGEREIVIEYWFRVLIGTDIAIQDIRNIALEYAKEYEVFDETLSHRLLEIEENGA